DVLDGLKSLKICTGYRLDGQAIDYMPAGLKAQAALIPVFEELDGWTETTQGARSSRDLPANAIKYVRRVEELIGAPVALLSTSPEREDTILVRDPFMDRGGGENIFCGLGLGAWGWFWARVLKARSR